MVLHSVTLLEIQAVVRVVVLVPMVLRVDLVVTKMVMDKMVEVAVVLLLLRTAVVLS